jgi:WD40 repeat protein
MVPDLRVYTADERPSRWRWITRLFAGILAISCCVCGGLSGWIFAPFSAFSANMLDFVQGDLTMVAPAEWQPAGGKLSPDGRYLILGWKRYGPHETFIWDLATGQRIPLTINASRLCWLTNNQFAMYDSSDDTYYLMDVPTFVSRPISDTVSLRPESGVDESLVLREWTTADRIYSLQPMRVVLTIVRNTPTVYTSTHLHPRLVAALQELPQVTTIPSPCGRPPIRARVFSPDGQWYAQQSNDGRVVRIYHRDGVLVAQARKLGWYANLLGWAHDSSGVYFQTAISTTVVVPPLQRLEVTRVQPKSCPKSLFSAIP